MTELSKKVITFGCRLNNLESELIDQQLKQHSIDKNTFIFNTCAVTSEAERKARQSIRKIKKENPNAKIVVCDKITEGAACTTLLARKFIDTDSPLLMANSDQIIDWDSGQVMYSFANSNIDGGILTFDSSHPKWSYAKVDKNNFVIEVAEKKPISNHATVGIYYWKKGSDYVKYADKMIKKNIRVNNEFYVCPVFNEAIYDKKRIIIDPVDEMHGLGTPDDLNNFLSIKNKLI